MSAVASPAPHSVSIARRFRGPERTGNGGYTAGLLASDVDVATSGAPVTVTLRRPPPLEVEMDVRQAPSDDSGGGVELWYDDQLIATASAGSFAAEPVPSVSFEDAAAARSSYGGLVAHPFPECFVCGPAREPGDGLRLAPGLVRSGETACVWMPDPALASDDDATTVGAEFVWAALDCPGGWTSDLDHRPLVLGRMTAVVYERPRVGRIHVVTGAFLREDGRKTFTATSLFDGDRLLARAEHTWLAIDPAVFNA